MPQKTEVEAGCNLDSMRSKLKTGMIEVAGSVGYEKVMDGAGRDDVNITEQTQARRCPLQP